MFSFVVHFKSLSKFLQGVRTRCRRRPSAASLGVTVKEKYQDKSSILIILARYINLVIFKYRRIYLRAGQRQNVCTFSGSLTVASDPQSVANRTKKRRSKCLFAIYRTVWFVLQSSGMADQSYYNWKVAQWYLHAEYADRRLRYSFGKTSCHHFRHSGNLPPNDKAI